MEKQRNEYFRNEADKLLLSLNEIVNNFNLEVQKHKSSLEKDIEKDIEFSKNHLFGEYTPRHLDKDICDKTSLECSNLVLRFSNLVFGYNPNHPLMSPLKKALDFKFTFTADFNYFNKQLEYCNSYNSTSSKELL